ncbi:MAG: hypothetical protein ABIG63_01895 [Chloroflexota bacterium]
MNHISRITQAYPQTPWRKQLQGIGTFLAVLVVCALVTGIYLNVTSRAATIGRQIQIDRNTVVNLERDIADKQSQLASLTSAVEMEQRASEMGFHLAASDEILYILVAGYEERPRAVLASSPQSFVTVAPTLSPAFTQSLLDWIRQEVALPAASIGSTKP